MQVRFHRPSSLFIKLCLQAAKYVDFIKTETSDPSTGHSYFFAYINEQRGHNTLGKYSDKW